MSRRHEHFFIPMFPQLRIYEWTWPGTLWSSLMTSYNVCLATQVIHFNDGRKKEVLAI